jgi:hypothetical protein
LNLEHKVQDLQPERQGIEEALQVLRRLYEIRSTPIKKSKADREHPEPAEYESRPKPDLDRIGE